MNWDEIKKKIGEYAPTVLDLIGDFVPGPVGLITGTAGKVIKQVFGTDKVEELSEIMTTDPNLAFKFKELEVTAQNAKLKHAYDMSQLQLMEMQNAREREKVIIQTVGVDKDKRFLTFAGILAPIGFMAYLLNWGLPEFTQQETLLIGNLIGIMFAKYSTIYDYHMGTSLGMERANASYNIGRVLDATSLTTNGKK